MDGVDGALAGMFEIDRDAGADRRLHLADAPIGLSGMAHQRAWLKERLHPTGVRRRV